jgi:hypothetical protein
LDEFEAERDAIEKLRRASNQLEKKQNNAVSQVSISATDMGLN